MGFPAMADVRDKVEPVPRRLRGLVAGETVFDTRRGLYVWDTVKYPHYLVPWVDVVDGCLVDEGREQRLRRGVVQLHGLRAGGTSLDSVARVYGDASGALAGYVKVDWDAVDWFEEDEQVLAHPRNPTPAWTPCAPAGPCGWSSTATLLAETHSPVLVFETGLPTRYYLDRSSLDLGLVRRTETSSASRTRA